MTDNMSDRELLELAAKAYTGGHFFGFDDKGNALIDPVVYCPFNPLVNDGDALRLAVKLKIEIERSKYVNSTVYAGPPNSLKWKEETTSEQCIYMATRRAITIAAAEIGRMM